MDLSCGAKFVGLNTTSLITEEISVVLGELFTLV